LQRDLQRLSELARCLIRLLFDSVGQSLIETDGDRFSWPFPLKQVFVTSVNVHDPELDPGLRHWLVLITIL
jgi:hypothetical protein